MSELFEKSIRTLELPAVLELLSEQARQRRGQAAGQRPPAGDGAGGGAAPSGPDRRGPEPDRPAGQPVVFRREAGGGGPGPGGPGAAASTTGSC